MTQMSTRDTTPSFVELFTPKLITILREGYGLAALRADAIAGLTVAIVALPLSMAIAIASGVSPDRGLYTAIVGGFLVSALGGSRFQIGGPAGAFIVLVLATVQVHGVDGLIIATFLSGFMLMAIGFLRLGTFIKFIPYPVTIGFTAGIAFIILSSQIKDLLGLTLPGQEPGPIVPKLKALYEALPTISIGAVGISLLTILLILVVRQLRPRWPSMLIAVAASTLVAWGLGLPIETIGTKFGGIPQSLPAPQLPDLSLGRVITLLPVAASFALLGGIESLLSAVVADSMTGRRHRSNCELVAQGIANIGSSLFGGFCVTGTIARTATNIRSGARSPMAGMFHALFLVVFILVAAPLASYIPLSALAGVLAVVAWNMAERHQFAALVRASWGDAAVLLSTFLITIFRDLIEGILVGFSLGALLFLHRMSVSTKVEMIAQPLEDQADEDPEHPRTAYDYQSASEQDIIVYRISGAFFFGATATVATALERIGEAPKAYVVDFSAVPVIDSTAAATMQSFAERAQRQKALVLVAGASHDVRHVLKRHGIHPPLATFHPSIHDAMTAARSKIEKAKAAAVTA